MNGDNSITIYLKRIITWWAFFNCVLATCTAVNLKNWTEIEITSPWIPTMLCWSFPAGLLGGEGAPKNHRI